MIVVRFTSGLGNQMFQYNFYRLLRERYGEVPVKADLTWFYANDDHHGYELQRIFGAVRDTPFFIEEATKGELFKVTGLIPNMRQPSDMLAGCKTSSVNENSAAEKSGYGKYIRESAGRFERFRRYPNRILRELSLWGVNIMKRRSIISGKRQTIRFSLFFRMIRNLWKRNLPGLRTNISWRETEVSRPFATCSL